MSSAKNPLEYSELNAELIERFPELFGGYAELKAMWDGDEPGPHVLYGDTLVPYIAGLLKRDDSELSLLRVFKFLEELAGSEDRSIRDLLGASVLEGLYGFADVRDRAQEYMGPRTKQLAENIGKAWRS